MKKQFLFFCWILLPAFFLATSGCGKAKPPAAKPGDPGVIARVNGDPITTKDLKRELAIRAKQDPAFQLTPRTLDEQLDFMINRRLLIQEAMRRKLPEKERFVNTIRNFWEQTLIKALMDEMTGELEEDVFVTEPEIQHYYQQLGVKATFQIAKATDQASMDQLLEKVRKGETIHWEKQIGPVGYDELPLGMLAAAFPLPVGESRVVREGGLYYLIRISAKDPASPPPLAEIREEIKSQIKQTKQRMAFEQWLKEIRGKAKIEIQTQPPHGKVSV